MRTRVVLALTVIAFLVTGRAPGVRELRNPDAEHGGTRIVVVLKRGMIPA